MKTARLYFLFCLVAVFMAAGMAACTSANVDSIQREDLFSLDIGPMEDQIALYSLEGNARLRHVEIAMRDGFFYIADNNGGKIVRYNSYGDLLFMVYNDETNPEPAGLKTKVEDGAQVTRWAFTYPLRSTGKIAVDSRKHIYVEERLPYERHNFDAENKALLDSVILHFDADGRFIEYLGQGGQGGSPFPLITGLYSSVLDEIAVICRLPSGWNVYWYSAQGEQLFFIQLENNAIPAPPDWPGFSASVDAIIAAPDVRKLYIKVDYYRDVFDESTDTRASTEPVSSLIWILDVEKGIYERSVEAPFYEYSFSENGKTVYARLLYSMLGIVRGGGILLYFPIENGYAVLRIDSDGHRQRRGFIEVNPEELRFNNFHLSPEGILSALLVSDWKIKVVWWRMDKFMRDAL
ncbi:MAG: hypothetical protein LBB89_07300 [Treponema sp.]|jgi:hypothetical protein|nr:hypothetical protein [Treponema sp.]